jgi:hypothetical protein
LDRRAGRYQIGRLDLAIGRGEVDDRGALRLGADIAAAIAAAMSGETPEGSPEGSLPVTSRKLPMLIAARSTPVGASSETTC